MASLMAIEEPPIGEGAYVVAVEGVFIFCSSERPPSRGAQPLLMLPGLQRGTIIHLRHRVGRAELGWSCGRS